MASHFVVPTTRHHQPTEQKSNQKDNEMSFLNDFFCFVFVSLLSFFFFQLVLSSSLSSSSLSLSFFQLEAICFFPARCLKKRFVFFSSFFGGGVSGLMGNGREGPGPLLVVPLLSDWLACWPVEVTGLAQDWPIKSLIFSHIITLASPAPTLPYPTPTYPTPLPES